MFTYNQSIKTQQTLNNVCERCLASKNSGENVYNFSQFYRRSSRDVFAISRERVMPVKRISIAVDYILISCHFYRMASKLLIKHYRTLVNLATSCHVLCVQDLCSSKVPGWRHRRHIELCFLAHSRFYSNWTNSTDRGSQLQLCYADGCCNLQFTSPSHRLLCAGNC